MRPLGQVKRVLCYQLPPRRFLAEWCGGLSVFDALLVLAWLAINVVIIEQRVAYVYPMIQGLPASIAARLLQCRSLCIVCLCKEVDVLPLTSCLCFAAMFKQGIPFENRFWTPDQTRLDLYALPSHSFASLCACLCLRGLLTTPLFSCLLLWDGLRASSAGSAKTHACMHACSHHEYLQRIA